MQDRVLLAGVLLPYLLVWSGLPLEPVLFSHTLFTNGIQLILPVFLFLVFAGLVFVIMSHVDKPVTAVNEGK